MRSSLWPGLPGAGTGRSAQRRSRHSRVSAAAVDGEVDRLPELWVVAEQRPARVEGWNTRMPAPGSMKNCPPGLLTPYRFASSAERRSAMARDPVSRVEPACATRSTAEPWSMARLATKLVDVVGTLARCRTGCAPARAARPARTRRRSRAPGWQRRLRPLRVGGEGGGMAHRLVMRCGTQRGRLVSESVSVLPLATTPSSRRSLTVDNVLRADEGRPVSDEAISCAGSRMRSSARANARAVTRFPSEKRASLRIVNV